MGKLSSIEWTHHTFNPWMGCVKVSPACDHCYAEKLVTGRMGLQVWGKDAPRKETSERYWHQAFAWDRAAEAAGERHRVFCGSLCDVMEDRAADLNRIRGDLWKLIESTPHLDWLLLTKRPQNFRRFLPPHWLESPRPNVWGMATVESAEYLWRVTELLETPFAVRGLSIEPLLGAVDLALDRWIRLPRMVISELPFPPVPYADKGVYRAYANPLGALAIPSATDGKLLGVKPGEFERLNLDWVIVGGESGPGARPMEAAWAQSIRDQCVAAGVPFFFKQWGEHLGMLQEGARREDGSQTLNCSDRSIRVGKKAAGRLLDGREWNEIPKARA